MDEKGGLLLAQKKPKKALKYFEMALHLFYNENFLLHLARAQSKLKQWSKAKEACERLLRYNPEKSEAWAIKGEALKHLHQISLSRTCSKNAEKFVEKPKSLLE